jgi:hypothetical protein
MKPWLGVSFIILGLVFGGQAFADGPEVVNIDQKISIHADNITLGDLFRLWDQATGMHSMVAPELAEQRLSVRFTGLNASDALRRISDGHQFGYILAEDQVVVTPREPVEEAAAPETQETLPPDNEVSPDSEVSQDAGRMKPELLPPPQPTYIPTPFGPIESPSWNRPFIQLPPVDVAPPPPFFMPEYPPTPPAGAPNGPVQNNLFGQFPVYPH